MKNLTTLLLTLLVSGSLWAEDEFPIELTCESGAETILFYLNETREGSWYKFDESSMQPSGRGYKLGEKNFFKRKYEIRENTIVMNDGTFVNITEFQINRFSLGFYTWGPPSNTLETGQCYKGFKEYEKQI